MTLRKGHGNGAGVPRIEVSPPDEIPRGLQAPPQASSKRERRPNGTFAPGCRTAQSQGGKARKGKTRLAERLGLTGGITDERFAPYAAAARDFRRAQIRRLAQTVGGGECGPAPSSIIATAALQLAASRFALEVLGDLQLSSRLGNDSRQNLLAAHELCAREAEPRRAGGGDDVLAAIKQAGREKPPEVLSEGKAVGS